MNAPPDLTREAATTPLGQDTAEHGQGSTPSAPGLVVSGLHPDSGPPALWLMMAAGSIVTATLIGALMVASLAQHHPLWLIALNPLPRHLLLVAPHAPAIPFVLVATLRGLATCMVAYELARHYGERAGHYMEQRSPRAGATFRATERLFVRWSPLLLTAFPGITTSVLAGMGYLPRGRTALLSAAGLFAWACLNFRLGVWLAPWTAPIVRFLNNNTLSVTALIVAVAVVYHLTARRPASRADSTRSE